MNMLRIGAIIICALAILAGPIALKRHTTGVVTNREAPTAAIASAGPVEIPTANDRRRMTPAGVSPASEFLPQSDTTGLLQESLSIDDLLDELNADRGAEFIPVNRERFSAVLKSDPELRQAVAD